ncbi:MAG: radical SAM protein [Chloroflexi bacterium]|nr:radical SAM protein [Chloroflexota bacterium]
MSAIKTLAQLGLAAQYDQCSSTDRAPTRSRDPITGAIYRALMPDGKCLHQLKVLQTNICTQSCNYCPNRSANDIPRNQLSPDELARNFDEVVRRGRADSLFLSSGIADSPNHTAEHMLASVELLRKCYGFGGFIHFKLMPGVEDAIIERALQLAQRVSVNLEAPSAARLQVLSGSKQLPDLLTPLQRARRMIDREQLRVSMTTQLVVGAAGESDREILSTASALYQQLRLARTYYSAFRPIPRTPLEGHDPTPSWREHRLYQADFLLRTYGFGWRELVLDELGNLPRTADPKTLWALHHPEFYPVELNLAELPALLRVPGIGPTSANRLLHWRRARRLNSLEQLTKAGADARRAAPYILLAGVRPAHQLVLWAGKEQPI